MFSQRVRGGFNQNSNRRAYLEAKEGSSYPPAAGRGRGSSKFNSSWKDDCDKENFDQSNFSERQAKSGAGRGRGNARLDLARLDYKNDQMQKPYGFNRDQQQTELVNSSSAFDESKPVKSFNEAPIKNMGRGRGDGDSDTGRGRGRGNSTRSRFENTPRDQQQDANQGWSDNLEQAEFDPHHSETVPIPEEEECQEQLSHCSDEFEDCVIHPYDPASPLKDQKDGQTVFEEGEFLITAKERPFKSSSTFVEDIPLDQEDADSECSQGQAQVIELSEEAEEDKSTPRTSEQMHITQAEDEEKKEEVQDSTDK